MSDEPTDELIPAQIRRAFFEVLANMPTAKVTSGDLGHFESRNDFYPAGSDTPVSRLVINTLDRAANVEKISRVMGDCCTIGETSTVTFTLFTPYTDSMEASLERVEADFWPRFAKAELPDVIILDYEGVSTRPGPEAAECPHVIRTISFSCSYGFDASRPHEPTQLG